MTPINVFCSINAIGILTNETKNVLLVIEPRCQTNHLEKIYQKILK